MTVKSNLRGDRWKRCVRLLASRRERCERSLGARCLPATQALHLGSNRELPKRALRLMHDLE